MKFDRGFGCCEGAKKRNSALFNLEGIWARGLRVGEGRRNNISLVSGCLVWSGVSLLLADPVRNGAKKVVKLLLFVVVRGDVEMATLSEDLI